MFSIINTTGYGITERVYDEDTINEPEKLWLTDEEIIRRIQHGLPFIIPADRTFARDTISADQD